MKEVVNVEVILKAKIDACYLDKINPKDIEKLIKQFGTKVLRETEILYVAVDKGANNG
jgi:hypothetical protein